MKKFLFCLLCCVYWNVMQAQEYSGITGMIHVPTAEMATEGEARAGVFFSKPRIPAQQSLLSVWT